VHGWAITLCSSLFSHVGTGGDGCPGVSWDAPGRRTVETASPFSGTMMAGANERSPAKVSAWWVRPAAASRAGGQHHLFLKHGWRLQPSPFLIYLFFFWSVIRGWTEHTRERHGSSSQWKEADR
jgi:hypothetical protein